MLARLKRFDRLIAEGEAHLAKQRALIASAEAEGRSVAIAEQALAGFEAVLAECQRARDVTQELRGMLDAPRERRPWRRRPPE